MWGVSFFYGVGNGMCDAKIPWPITTAVWSVCSFVQGARIHWSAQTRLPFTTSSAIAGFCIASTIFTGEKVGNFLTK